MSGHYDAALCWLERFLAVGFLRASRCSVIARVPASMASSRASSPGAVSTVTPSSGMVTRRRSPTGSIFKVYFTFVAGI